MIRTNFHTHTTYCDGKNSVRQMIDAAIAGNFAALGFSGHSMVSADADLCGFMNREKAAEYCREIRALREEYRGRISIYCGIEQDLFSDDPPKGYEFVIGSAHYVEKDGAYLLVDLSAEALVSAITDHYAGDPYAFAEDYYREVITICADPVVDIVGHIDLLTKFNEIDPTFDESHPRYTAAWKNALEAVADSGKFLEINSGAIPRGYRTSCYPAPEIMKRALDLKIPLLLSCDCHSADSLASGWQLSYNYAISCGCTDQQLSEAQEAFLSRF